MLFLKILLYTGAEWYASNFDKGKGRVGSYFGGKVDMLKNLLARLATKMVGKLLRNGKKTDQVVNNVVVNVKIDIHNN